MRSIYLVSDFGTLAKRGETLVLRQGDAIAHTIFPFQTEAVYILGQVDITSAALRMLMRHRIETIFIGRNGRFAGKLNFTPGKNVFLRQKQFRSIEDPEYVLAMAKAIVKGKIRNQLTIFQRWQRNHAQASRNLDAKPLKNLLNSCDKASSLQSLRGYEGAAAKHYFQIFNLILQPEWAVFKGRSMNPPQDNVNAVLSFLYTMLLYRVESAILGAGLDPYIGYLHRMDYGAHALAFDLLEEFRAPLGDTTTIALFNLRTLSEDSFREETFSPSDDNYPLESEHSEAPPPEKKGVLLTSPALREVIAFFERKLDEPVAVGKEGKKIPYRELIPYQVLRFKRFLQGEANEYHPFRVN
jgi:CRISPR-associated protein Cas1